MSALAALVASWGASARPEATFVGWASGGEGNSVVNSLPVGTLAGDYMVITFYSGRTIGGGSGTAFPITFFGNTTVAHRLVEAGDLTNDITFSGLTPYIVGVWRGPVAMSAARSTLSSSGSTNYTMPGFGRSSRAIAIVGAGEIFNDTPVFRTGSYGPFETNRTQSTSGIGYGMGSIVDMAGYTGEDFTVSSDGGNTGGILCRIYELLY